MFHEQVGAQILGAQYHLNRNDYLQTEQERCIIFLDHFYKG